MLVFGRLAVDDKAGPARLLRRMECACAVLFLADDEQQSEIGSPAFEQLFGRRDHGSDNALGIAGRASPNEFVILPGRKKWRHRVHMRRESDVRPLSELCENVEAMWLDLYPLNPPFVLRGGFDRWSNR